MSNHVYITKEFHKMLRDLVKTGSEGKKAAEKAKQAFAEAQMDGKISLQLTHHGENRLPNVQKFGLSDNYRLVVQVIQEHEFAFLFVGDHEDADSWLEAHRGYRWIQNQSDQKLDFIYAPELENAKVVRGFDLDSSEQEMQMSLLKDLNKSEIDNLIQNEELKKFVLDVSAEKLESDNSFIWEHIIQLADNDSLAECLIDLLEISHAKGPNKLHEMRLIIAKYQCKANVVEHQALSDAMQNPVNADEIIEYNEDIKDFWAEHPEADWEDWMLFLNQKQKEWAIKDLNGPARLCGVSGSGKTCVMLHRARFLAKKYKEPVAIITLTISMKRLLENLLNRLCGVERSYIRTFTVAEFIRDEIIGKNENDLLRWVTAEKQWGEGDAKEIVKKISTEIFKTNEFQSAPWDQFNDVEKILFIMDEFNYVRTRLLPASYNEYASPSFKRTGREIPLKENMRKIILDGIKLYENQMEQRRWVDHESLTHKAMNVTMQNNALTYRSILIDEVQDLTQNDLRVIGALRCPTGEMIKDIPNGLFLVGDGAQTIYKNGFSLKKLGINIIGRSFAFKKNYRNTKQILEASYSLIQNFNCSNLDEDDVTKPILPELANKEGEKPKIVKTYSINKELSYITNTIKKFMQVDHRFENICVIGLNKTYRDMVKQALISSNIKCCEIKDGVQKNDNNIKISTIESAKGHEFSSVFIVGLGEPEGKNYSEEQMNLLASRLYVGMTRACDNLYLTYSSCPGYVPSFLLSYIQDYCEEIEIR